MPISQGNISSVPAGLKIVAWCVINGTTGALVKGFNVASTTRSVAGSYTFTLTSGVANADGAVVVAHGSRVGGSYAHAEMSSTTAGGANSFVSPGGALVDAESVHVTVYE